MSKKYIVTYEKPWGQGGFDFSLIRSAGAFSQFLREGNSGWVFF